MDSLERVLVCSASPDSINNNAQLRGYVAEGFRAILGDAAVRVTSLEAAEYCAEEFAPQLVLVFGSCMPAVSVYHGLKNYSLRTGACLAFWLHDDPYEFDFNYKILPIADVIFSNDRWAVTHYQHPRVHHVPLGASRAEHYRAPRPSKDREVFFCGVGFPNRVGVLRDCAPVLGDLKVEILGAEWPDTLKFARNERIDNRLLPDYYASSLVTLNFGRRFDLANARFNLDAPTPGPRTFEAAMAGTVQCMFVEGLEIYDYFDPDAGEILLFDTPAELRRHVEMLRDDPAKAAAIAGAAQARAIADHTYASRAQRILSLIGSYAASA
ncbi:MULTISPECIES: glycosyltransferase [unclassified Caballeronia]|uniref:CgeB family protein n=1 Tax=unclassified Caballeronia TaxID=2646786 RepID=UPI002027B885|nr:MULTISPECIES: glycosyltransferase [unclassified Caballeronia]